MNFWDSEIEWRMLYRTTTIPHDAPVAQQHGGPPHQTIFAKVSATGRAKQPNGATQNRWRDEAECVSVQQIPKSNALRHTCSAHPPARATGGKDPPSLNPPCALVFGLRNRSRDAAKEAGCPTRLTAILLDAVLRDPEFTINMYRHAHCLANSRNIS